MEKSEAFLRLPDVVRRAGYSKSRIYALVSSRVSSPGQFSHRPACIRVAQDPRSMLGSPAASLSSRGAAMSEIAQYVSETVWVAQSSALGRACAARHLQISSVTHR